MGNTIAHIEIPGTDIQALGQFYASQFGWQVQDAGMPGYLLFRTTPDGLGGGFYQSKEAVPDNQWGIHLYIEVQDIPGKLSDIETAGGKTVAGKTEIGGGHGFYAHFRDPQGNLFGLWSKE